MDENYGLAEVSANQSACIRDDLTVGQNIDAKIKRHQESIAELEATKAELASLLTMRIDRLRMAMNR